MLLAIAVGGLAVINLRNETARQDTAIAALEAAGAVLTFDAPHHWQQSPLATIAAGGTPPRGCPIRVDFSGCAIDGGPADGGPAGRRLRD